MSRKSIWTVLITLAVSGLTACSGGGSTPTPATVPTVQPSANPTPTPTPQIVIAEDGGIQFTVNLAINGSQQAGEAVFTQLGSVVDLRVNISPSAPVEMMSLRRGECPGPGVYERDLDPMIGGSSIQQIHGYGIDRLITGDMMLIVSAGHNSLEPIAACADLPLIEPPATASR